MRPKLPEDRKRVLVFGRVDPKTMEFIQSLNHRNFGRAFDAMASELKRFKSDSEPYASGSEGTIET
jgi:hypothetical protein